MIDEPIYFNQEKLIIFFVIFCSVIYLISYALSNSRDFGYFSGAPRLRKSFINKYIRHTAYFIFLYCIWIYPVSHTILEMIYFMIFGFYTNSAVSIINAPDELINRYYNVTIFNIFWILAIVFPIYWLFENYEFVDKKLQEKIKEIKDRHD